MAYVDKTYYMRKLTYLNRAHPKQLYISKTKTI
jgi:hypothetical protein